MYACSVKRVTREYWPSSIVYWIQITKSFCDIFLFILSSSLQLFFQNWLQLTMAPTICDDSMEPYGIHNSNRLRRQCSVINYGKEEISAFETFCICRGKTSVYKMKFMHFLCSFKIHFSAGHQIRRDDERRHDAVDSSEDKSRIRDQLSERRINNNIIMKRYRHEASVSSDSDNSSDSTSSPMAFHNYAKRRRLSETEDENYIR